MNIFDDTPNCALPDAAPPLRHVLGGALVGAMVLLAVLAAHAVQVDREMTKRDGKPSIATVMKLTEQALKTLRNF
jgi:hypothetical protein